MKRDDLHAARERRPYETPLLVPQGKVSDLTRWIGGKWGEFLDGQGSGWNPWDAPGTS